MKDSLTRLAGTERLGQNRNSEYLGAEDVDPGAEPIVTIEAIWTGEVTLQRGRETKDVLSFRETSVPGLAHVRPLIVNATNRKTLRRLFGAATAEALEGARIQLYVDHRVRDPETGGLTDGIRIRSRKPSEAAPIRCQECGQTVTAAGGMDPAALLAYSKNRFGRSMCAACMRAVQAQRDAAKAKENLGADTPEDMEGFNDDESDS